MKSFAVVAAFAGAAAAQNLGSCAQLCVNNMAMIAQTSLQCAQGDTNCFCTKSNWAYGIRDCTRQACGDAESAAAVAWAAQQCVGAIGSSATQVPAAIPILTGALASASGAAASAAASVVSNIGSAASAVTTIPLVGSVTNSAGSVVPTTTGFSTLFGSAASQASGIAASASSAASGAAASASSAAASAISSASGAVESLQSSASGLLASLTSAAGSATSAAGSAARSATSAAGSAASSAVPGSAPIQTALPVLAGAGAFAMLFL